MQLQTINTLADWHGSKAMEAYVETQHMKNYSNYCDLMREYGRHIIIHDRLRCAAWVMEHRTKPGKR